MGLLSVTQIQEMLDEVPGWDYDNNALVKQYTFNNFKEALSFVNSVGDIAEELEHHPDILLHGYKNVKLTLSSHDMGGVTDRDIKTVKKIEESQ